MSIIPKKYAYDPTAAALANTVVGEVHTIGQGDVRTLVPLYGPFYAHTVNVYDRRTGTRLIHNVQYKTLYMDETLSLKTRHEVCGVIAVVDPTLPNSLEVDVHYQVVGGEYTDYQQLILEMLKTQTIDERGVAWGDIKGKPSLFKPTPHDHDVGDLYGWEYVVNQLTKIREAILISDKAVHEEIIRVFDANATSLDEDIEQVKITILDRLSQHTARTDNPHGTTKAQAGLGQAPNYPPASVAITTQGLSEDTLVVPRGARRAIEVLGAEPLQAHMDRTDNPHFTTKDQLNLGQVQNYPTATDEQAALGDTNNAYITPYGVKLQVLVKAIEPLQAHAGRTDNPHGTTKAHLGLDLVPNYPPATLAMAALGDNDETLLTPASAWVAIQALLTDPITAHKANLNNPHGTTKASLGLGQVDNFSRTYYDARYAAIDHIHGYDSLPFEQADVTRWNEAKADLDNAEGFDPTGPYINLRAGGTTKEDVGLSDVPNWSEADFNSRFAAADHVHENYLTLAQADENYAKKSELDGLATYARDYAEYATTVFISGGSATEPTFP